MNKKLIQYLKIPFRYPILDYLLTIALVSVVEWKNYDFYHINRFPDIGDLIFLAISLPIAYGIVSLVRRAFSSSEVQFNNKVKEEIDRIIDEADEYLYLISPYLDPGNILIESILKKLANSIPVVLVHHSSQIDKPEALQALQRLQPAGCKIFHHPNLHAKIYMNENEVIITSLNLVAGSFKNSLESGYITSSKEIHRTTWKFIEEDILKSGLKQESDVSDTDLKTGYCIRTKARIPLNRSRPIEHDEYNSSGRAKNGIYCHYCGEEAKTSVEQPYCEMHKNLLIESMTAS